jgi:hypothetical protein
MSEPDDKPRRRPPTIDLTATEVEAAATAAASDPAAGESGPSGNAAAPSAPRADRLWSYAAGAVGGAILVVLIVGGLWFAGFGSPPLGSPREVAAPAPMVAATDSTAIDTLSARLAKVEAAIAAPRSDAALTARVSSAESEAKSATEALGALNRRLDGIEAGARDARNRADEASMAADAARRAIQSNSQRGDLDALANRVAALEGSVKAMGDAFEKRIAGGGDRAARMVLAAEALRAAVERGRPYGPALAAVKALGADQNAVSSLAPFAAAGVPSAAVLAQELSAMVPAIRQASGIAPSKGGFLDRLQANAERLVRVTPIDAPSGDDSSAVIARIEAVAARADINGALAELAKLPENARATAAPWVERAQGRNAALAASRRVAGDALAALTKPASTAPAAQ